MTAKFKLRVATFCLLVLVGNAAAKEWKSGELISTDTWTYGTFETSMKAASGSGGITGFVLIVPDPRTQGWQELGVEVFGKDPSRYQTQVIVPSSTLDPDGAPRQQFPVEGTVPGSLADSFHVYKIDWNPTKVDWSIDGNIVRTIDSSNSTFTKFWGNDVQPMQLRVTLWAGFSNWSGKVNADAPPDEAQFEYIMTPTYTDEFDTFDATKWKKNDQTDVFLVNDFVPDNAKVEGGNLVLDFTR